MTGPDPEGKVYRNQVAELAWTAAALANRLLLDRHFNASGAVREAIKDLDQALEYLNGR